MKKRKKIILWIAISCVIIVVGIVFFVLVSAHNSLTVREANDVVMKSIETSFSQIRDNSNPLISEVLEESSVTVLSTSKKGSVVTARCEVRSRDAYEVIKNIDSNYGEKMTTLFQLLEVYEEELRKTDFVENEVDVLISKEEGEWVVEYSYEFLDALTGGYLQYSSELIGELVAEE